MRVQHAINGLKHQPGVRVRVIILRQSSSGNVLRGVHQEVPFETVMGDVGRTKFLLLAPLFHAKAKRHLEDAFRPGLENVIHVYGPPCFDNLPTIKHARKLGFKVVFDIVEDDDLAFNISNSPWHRLNNLYKRRAAKTLPSLANGIVVISSYLKSKLRTLTNGQCPIHYRPVSVDMSLYPEGNFEFSRSVALFYSGSFGVKDGISVLLNAFDLVCARQSNTRLVLTGRGDPDRIRELHARLHRSPHRERINYRGYLNTGHYYAALNSADIPCMTRIDSGFANAGFPFKLGEYLASGKPVIASRVSDVPKLLEDGQNAMLVPAGDSAAIAEAVEFLLLHPKEAAAIGKRGRKIAEQLFDFRKQGRALLDFFHEIAIQSKAAQIGS